MYKNKKIFIIGLARSGYECAKLLLKYNNDITLVEYNNEDSHIEELKKLGANVIICPKEEQASYLDNSFDMVVRNPGVPLDSPCVVKANELNLRITGEVDIAYNLMPEDIKIIAITGSNGKTTTTTMIYEMMEQANLPVHLGGNIGYPVTSLVKSIKSKDILVLEISDHQLVNMQDFKSDISVLTNIVESHLDFHGTFEKYCAAKKKIFNNHTQKDLAIINASNDVSLALTKDIKSKKEYFSSVSKAEVYVDANAIYYHEKIIDLKDIKLVGKHNYENIMAAIRVVKEFGVDNQIIKNYLGDFGGVEHRMEYVKEHNKVAYYNDAKSTNVEATLTALKSFNKPIHLLLGGLDRGHSFIDLAKYKDAITCVYAYGEVKGRILDFCNKYEIDCTSTETLKEATNAAITNAKENSVVLLSPACASWDQYKKFEDRGQEFKDIINNL